MIGISDAIYDVIKVLVGAVAAMLILALCMRALGVAEPIIGKLYEAAAQIAK